MPLRHCDPPTQRRLLQRLESTQRLLLAQPQKRQRRQLPQRVAYSAQPSPRALAVALPRRASKTHPAATHPAASLLPMTSALPQCRHCGRQRRCARQELELRQPGKWPQPAGAKWTRLLLSAAGLHAGRFCKHQARGHRWLPPRKDRLEGMRQLRSLSLPQPQNSLTVELGQPPRSQARATAPTQRCAARSGCWTAASSWKPQEHLFPTDWRPVRVWEALTHLRG